MTRLRLAPSSAERMIGLIRQIDDWVCWLVMSSESSVDCRRDCAGLSDRALRLLLRWFAAGREMAVEAGFNDPEESLCERLYWYQRAFERRYEFWPSRGDESLRRELDE